VWTEMNEGSQMKQNPSWEADSTFR
jgi:hypothetical protein